MPVFISYSHQDRDFVDKLAFQLIKAKAQVWLDRWEIRVGESLISRVQEAVAGASALVVVLSKASVDSDWCKKELNAGLIRELEEKRVVVLPVLIEDCAIPLFLREKMYADFRTDFDAGLRAVLEALARVTNDARSRVETAAGHTDWSIDWGREDGRAKFVLSFVETTAGRPYTTLTQIVIRGNDAATKRFDLYSAENLMWVFRHHIVELFASVATEKDLRILLEDSNPARRQMRIADERSPLIWEAEVECRLMGDDTGADVLLDVGGQLRGALRHIESAARNPTAAEFNALRRIAAAS